MFAVTRQRLGHVAGHTKTLIGHVDKGIRTAGRVFHAVKDHIPDSQFKKIASKGFSDYETVREKVRGGY